MIEKPSDAGNLSPEQVLGGLLASAVGEDGTMLEMIALTIRPGYWPTVTLRKRLRPPELEAAVKIFQRFNIVGIQVKEHIVTSGHQEGEKADYIAERVRRDKEGNR